MSSEPREYLIRKGGYYYRPNCSGYTTSKFEAGRYTKAEAEREAAVEPWHMSAIHQDEITDEPEVVDFKARIEALEAEVARLREALSEVEEILDGEPEYHIQGMGCGLEDRNITDRYEAMEHGWECAMERVYGEHVNPAKEIARRAREGGNEDG